MRLSQLFFAVMRRREKAAFQRNMKDLPHSYFRHDATASLDVKMIMLRSKFGFEGLGLYWYMIEALYLNEGRMNADALRSQCDRIEIFEFCIKIGLFVIDEFGEIASLRLLDEIENRIEKSKKATESAKRRWRKERKKSGYANAMRTQCERNARRGEERREKDTNVSLDSGESPTPEKIDRRNPYVQRLIDCLKDAIGLPVLDGSEQGNRRAAFNALRKITKVTASDERSCAVIEHAIRQAAIDKWHADRMTSMKYVADQVLKLTAQFPLTA